MEVKSALRSALKHPWALLLQALCLSVGLALLVASSQLGYQLRGDASIPGATCAAGISKITGTDGEGNFVDRFTPSQVSRLRTLSAQKLYPYVLIQAPVTVGDKTTATGVFAADSTTIARLCVEGGPLLNGAAGRAALTDAALRAPVGAVAMFAGTAFPVVGTTHAFHGVTPRQMSSDVVLPLEALSDTSLDPGKADIAMLAVLVDSNVDTAALNRAVGEHPEDFPGITQIKVVRSLTTSGADASVLSSYATMLQLVGAAILLLGAFSLVLYYFGRQATFAHRVRLLQLVGAPRAVIRRYAWVEPLLVSAISAILALLLLPLLLDAVNALVGTISVDLSAAGLRFAQVAVVVVSTLIIAVLVSEGRLLSLRVVSSAALLRASNRVFDILSVGQSALAVATLCIALAAAGAYYRALPSAAGYTLDGVRVYAIKPDNQRSMADVFPRLSGTLDALASTVHGVAAVTTTPLPIPFWSYEKGYVENGSNKANVSIDRVTPDFFKLIQMDVTAGHGFTFGDVGGSYGSESRAMVINAAAAKMLALHGTGVVSLQSVKSPKPSPVQVVGQVDEKNNGRSDPDSNGATPAIYLPMREPSRGIHNYLIWLRPGPGVTAPGADAAAKAAATRLTPSGIVDWIRTGPQLFAEATAKERGIFLLFAVLALGTIAISTTALSGMSFLRLSGARISYAVRFSTGEPARSLCVSFAGVILGPVAFGAAVGLGLAYIGSAHLAMLPESIGDVMLPACVVALLLYLVIGLVSIAGATASLYRATFSEWLRSD